MRTRSHALVPALASVLALLALAPRARAQAVEARCPAGWTGLTVPEPPSQRIVAVCTQGEMEMITTELPLPEDATLEGGLSEEITAQGARGGNVTVTPFRNERIANVNARVADVQGTAPRRDGTTTPLEGLVMLIPVRGTTVFVRANSRDPSHQNVRAAARAYVPTIAGLTGPAPTWRASAACPGGMQTFPPQMQPGFGLRRVVVCVGDGVQLNVLESRLPVRALPDVVASAQAPFEWLRRSLAQRGGTLTQDAPRPVTVGANHGWVVALHGAEPREEGPPGGPAGVSVEALVAVIPTSAGGHVRIVAISQEHTSAEVERAVSQFVGAQLRTDGTAAPDGEPGGPAGGGGDGGAGASASGGDAGEGPSAPAPSPATQRRPSGIDPNVPIWEPPPEQLGRPQEQSRGGGEANSEATKKYAIGFIAVFVAGLLGWWLWQRRR